MERDIIPITREELTRYVINEKLAEYGKPLFLVISGSDAFGFPSHDSDIDVKGVYMAPTDRFLGLRRRSNKSSTFEYMSPKSVSPDKRLDVSIDEIGDYLRFVYESNGNRVEWPNSRLVLFSSPEFEGLKGIVNSSLSKELLLHYQNFARDMWRGKSKAEGVKKDLYTLRTYMSGINIFETGQVETDLNELNKRFGEKIVDDIVKLKSLGEHTVSANYDREKLDRVIAGLDSRLRSSASGSSLPERPDFKQIDDFLIKLRAGSQ